MRQKIEEYFSIGVEQVSVVEPVNHTVVVYESTTVAKRSGMEYVPAGAGAVRKLQMGVAGLPPTERRSSQDAPWHADL